MLITFTTDAYADITMFGDVAFAMLKMMGHSQTVPGAILVADVPRALSRLKAAINAEKTSLPSDEEDEEDEEDEKDEKDEKDEPVVSMADRALPLIELLTAAEKAECNVMWNKS